MPRVKCPKCQKVETVLRSGFIRNKQRYYCKECIYHFTLHHEDRKARNKSRGGGPTTIKDIAQAMGISPSTVSRALHDHEDINIHTREAVKKLAKELNYHPNLMAINFATKNSKTVGVIIPSLDAAFFSKMLGGIQRIASAAGYRIIICQSDENYITEIENAKTLIDNCVDGLLVCHTREQGSFLEIEHYSKNYVPIIHFYRLNTEKSRSQVTAEDVEGAYLVTEHLIKNGRRRIGIILGPENLYNSNLRLEGYKRALKKYDLEIRPEWINHTDLNYDAVTGVVNTWLLQDAKPDAIFCIADQCAMYTIKYLKNIGITIPDEIAVAGFGNHIMGEFVEPGLTTFDVNSTQIGEMAMKLCLTEMKQSTPVYTKKKVEGRLIIRQSTKKTD